MHILQEASTLAMKIADLEDDLTQCNIMYKNKHTHLEIKSNMKFKLPDSQAETVLLIAKNAIERELQEAKEKFEKL